MAKPSTTKTARKPATKRPAAKTNKFVGDAKDLKVTKAPAAKPAPTFAETLDPTTLWPKTEDEAFAFVRAAIAEDQKRRKGQTHDMAIIDNFTAWAKAGRPHAKNGKGNGGGGGRVSIDDDALDVIVKGYLTKDPNTRPPAIFEGIRADGGKVGDKRTIASWNRVRASMGLGAPAKVTKTPAPAKAGPKAKASKAPAKSPATGRGKAPTNPNGKAGRRAATKARVQAQAQSGTVGKSTAAAKHKGPSARKTVR